jgi:hypothetical protein
VPAPRKLPPFENALLATLSIAQVDRLSIILRLYDGEDVEGVPTNVEGKFGAEFGGVSVDIRAGEDDPADTYTTTITVNGRKYLPEQVAEFTLKRP